jgi:hypothetical protein
MQTFYLDTSAGNWYNDRGESFRSNQPSMAFQTQDELKIITVAGAPEAETENINPAIDWPRDTQWAGMAAKIAVDNDTIHRIKGIIAEPITAGAVTSITATIANASQATIPGDGKLTIYAADSSSEIISYASREISGTAVVFTLVEGEEIRKSYPAGSVMDCPQSPYCSALMNPDKSNPLAGEFAFDLVVDSRRLREEMLYASKDRLPVKGMELLFYRETETATIPVRAFLLSTFSIVGLLNDVNAGADLPEDDAIDRLNALVYSVLSAGEEVQYSVDGITWLLPEEVTDPVAVKYFRSRNRKTKGEWSDPVPVIAGPEGPEGQQGIQGETGPQGKAATISVGTVTTGLPGSEAKVENVGTENAAVINFTIPRGAAFTIDATGTLEERSAYDSEAKGFSYLATDDGCVYIKNSDTSGDWSDAIPFKGDPGQDGEDGQSATISVGSVATLPPGDDAFVESEGTENAVVLNFGIPKGEKGDQGEPGERIEANYIELDTATGGYMVIPADTVPVAVEIGGVIYNIDSGWITKVNDNFRIPVAPFLAEANLSAFVGPWRVWRAGGKQGEAGATGGTFVIEVVDKLPEVMDQTTLYLVPEGV